MTEGRKDRYAELTGLEPSPHEHNIYCEPGLCAHPMWCAHPMDFNIIAIVVGDVRHNVVRWIEAPELPPIDPNDPAQVAYPYRYVVWSVPS